MRPSTVVRTLVESFRRLTITQRRRLAAHARAKTPVHVGGSAVDEWIAQVPIASGAS